MKKYCKNCRYFDFGFIYSLRCNYPDNFEIKEWSIEPMIMMIRQPTEINRDNNCHWFKRKKTFFEYIFGEKKK